MVVLMAVVPLHCACCRRCRRACRCEEGEVLVLVLVLVVLLRCACCRHCRHAHRCEKGEEEGEVVVVVVVLLHCACCPHCCCACYDFSSLYPFTRLSRTIISEPPFVFPISSTTSPSFHYHISLLHHLPTWFPFHRYLGL